MWSLSQSLYPVLSMRQDEFCCPQEGCHISLAWQSISFNQSSIFVNLPGFFTSYTTWKLQYEVFSDMVKYSACTTFSFEGSTDLKYKWSYPEEFSDLICCIDKWNFNGTKQHFGVAITRERPVQWCHEHRYNSCLWLSWTIPALLYPTTFYAVVKQTQLLVQCRKVKLSFVVIH